MNLKDEEGGEEAKTTMCVRNRRDSLRQKKEETGKENEGGKGSGRTVYKAGVYKCLRNQVGP